MSTDMLYVPLMALFFFEVISPGWVTLRRIIGMSMPSVLFIVAYIIYPSSVIFKAAMLYALVFGTIITVIVFMASSRRDNYIKNNFSDIENLSISWVRKAITALYICLGTLDHSPLGRKLVERCRLLCNIYYRLDLYLSIIPKTFGYRNAEYVQIIYAET